MKKIIKGILVLVLCFGVIGCGKSDEKEDEKDWYESILTNIENSDLKIHVDSDYERIYIFEGEENNSSTWTREINVTFVPEDFIDKFDTPVWDIKYESDYDINGALSEIDEGYVDVSEVGRDAFINGNMKYDTEHWKDVYPQFKQMINEIGINNNEEFLTFCENVYEIEIEGAKNN